MGRRGEEEPGEEGGYGESAGERSLWPGKWSGSRGGGICRSLGAGQKRHAWHQDGTQSPLGGLLPLQGMSSSFIQYSVFDSILF